MVNGVLENGRLIFPRSLRNLFLMLLIKIYHMVAVEGVYDSRKRIPRLDGSLFIFRMPDRCASDVMLRHLTLPEILETLAGIHNVVEVTVQWWRGR
jgi:hypothetical protein